MCICITEEEYRMLNIREGIVGGQNVRSLGTPSNKEEHGNKVIVDVAGLEESGGAGI